jgi:Response regulator receiver domain
VERLSETTPYRLVIADDHPLFRGALREAVAGQFAAADIAEAGTFEDVVAQLERGGDVDLVLLDLAMPGVRGFSGPTGGGPMLWPATEHFAGPLAGTSTRLGTPSPP